MGEDVEAILERSEKAISAARDTLSALRSALDSTVSNPPGSLGVSCIVRIHDAGGVGRANMDDKLGMVVSQNCEGTERYSVMFPGDPTAYAFRAKNLEVLSGIDPQVWWKV